MIPPISPQTRGYPSSPFSMDRYVFVNDYKPLSKLEPNFEYCEVRTRSSCCHAVGTCLVVISCGCTLRYGGAVGAERSSADRARGGG